MHFIFASCSRTLSKPPRFSSAVAACPRHAVVGSRCSSPQCFDEPPQIRAPHRQRSVIWPVVAITEPPHATVSCARNPAAPDSSWWTRDVHRRESHSCCLHGVCIRITHERYESLPVSKSHRIVHQLRKYSSRAATPTLPNFCELCDSPL